mmetsp:Transcript_3242/g.8480  ORF Transcript_3242/g.8480 Transcript_3242/m.8480 type:complete len:460 (+) Transcript_3242:530-1909(+)
MRMGGTSMVRSFMLMQGGHAACSTPVGAAAGRSWSMRACRRSACGRERWPHEASTSAPRRRGSDAGCVTCVLVEEPGGTVARMWTDRGQRRQRSLGPATSSHRHASGLALGVARRLRARRRDGRGRRGGGRFRRRVLLTRARGRARNRRHVRELGVGAHARARRPRVGAEHADTDGIAAGVGGCVQRGRRAGGGQQRMARIRHAHVLERDGRRQRRARDRREERRRARRRVSSRHVERVGRVLCRAPLPAGAARGWRARRRGQDERAERKRGRGRREPLAGLCVRVGRPAAPRCEGRRVHPPRSRVHRLRRRHRAAPVSDREAGGRTVRSAADGRAARRDVPLGGVGRARPVRVRRELGRRVRGLHHHAWHRLVHVHFKRQQVVRRAPNRRRGRSRRPERASRVGRVLVCRGRAVRGGALLHRADLVREMAPRRAQEGILPRAPVVCAERAAILGTVQR